jgi:hypothetical protein
MGQYYRAISVDKKECVSPYDYENGAKLMEHSYIGNEFVNAVESLLIPTGSWYKNHFVWAGDYADDEDESLWTKLEDEYPNKNLYAIFHDNVINPDSVKLPKDYKFLCNYTKKEYVDYSKVKPTDGKWKINPLPLLTCDGNGRGGGDFRNEEDERVGSWKRDIIGIEVVVPNGFTEIDGTFIEH